MQNRFSKIKKFLFDDQINNSNNQIYMSDIKVKILSKKKGCLPFEVFSGKTA